MKLHHYLWRNSTFITSLTMVRSSLSIPLCMGEGGLQPHETIYTYGAYGRNFIKAVKNNDLV